MTFTYQHSLQTLRRRLDPPKHTGPFFAWHDFRNPAFNVYIFAGILNFLGLYTRRFHHLLPAGAAPLTRFFMKVLTYIDLSATTVGISPEFSFYLVSITNAGSGLGRVVSGILADKVGALTVTAPLTLLCAIMTYVWPFATTKGSLVVIGIIYGFCSGAYVSLLPAPLMMMGDMHDAGRRSGTALTGIALGAVAGPPISGAIAQATGGFKAVGYYAGTVPEHHLHSWHLTEPLLISFPQAHAFSGPLHSYTSRNT